jgi:hypothetical protein
VKSWFRDWLLGDEEPTPLYAELGLDAATAKAMLLAQRDGCPWCVVEILEDHRSMQDCPSHTVHYQAAHPGVARKLAAEYREFATATGDDTALTPIRIAYPDGTVKPYTPTMAEQ